MAIRLFFSSPSARYIYLGLMVLVWSLLPATVWATGEPSVSTPLTRSELETLLKAHPHVDLADAYVGPMPTRTEVQQLLTKVAEIESLLDAYNANSPNVYVEDGTDLLAADTKRIIKRTCNDHTSVLGRVRFEFWLESESDRFTDINRFKTTFIPAPTLPTIGGVDLESIEGDIYNDYHYKVNNGRKWAGEANVEIIYVIFEYIEVYRYYFVQCSVSHP